MVRGGNVGGRIMNNNNFSWAITFRLCMVVLLSGYIYIMSRLHPESQTFSTNVMEQTLQEFVIQSSKNTPDVMQFTMVDLQQQQQQQQEQQQQEQQQQEQQQQDKETKQPNEIQKDIDTTLSGTRKEQSALNIVNITTNSNNNETKPEPEFDLSNLEGYYNISLFLSNNNNNLWNNNSKLPNWMVRYFNWHQWKRSQWNPNTTLWESERWLIMQCIGEHDKNCGGTADRLKPTPWALRVAYNTKRILLIYWTKPSALEEFLLPPQGGFDWRVPNWLATHLQNKTNGKRLVPSTIIRNYAAGNMSLIRSRYQSYNGGSEWYNEQLSEELNEPTFDEIYHDVWNIFFTPSPNVANIIKNELYRMSLIPGHYASAHLRALYNRASRPENDLRILTYNALNCASQLRPGKPIFFASDSNISTYMAIHYDPTKNTNNNDDNSNIQSSSSNNENTQQQQHNNNNIVIAYREHDPNPPLHLDKTKNWRSRSPSDYYDTFVDLYLLALGQCVTYFQGGYGHWGLLIGGNISCVKEQVRNSVRNTCEWNNKVVADTTAPKTFDDDSLFLKPMES